MASTRWWRPVFRTNTTGCFSDFHVSDRDQVRGRYISTKISGIDTAATLPIFFTSRPTTEKLGTVSEIHNFTPTLFNEVRVAFNRYNDDIHVTDDKFPGLDAFPNIVIRDDLNLNIGPNPNAPQGTKQTTYQIVDNVSWQKGRHELKFGVDLRRLDAASTFIQRVRGDYEWTTLQGYLTTLSLISSLSAMLAKTVPETIRPTLRLK
jgi:hypothetical protein